MPQKKWIEIEEGAEVPGILAPSTEYPVVIYKHSISCPISSGAWYEVQSYLAGSTKVDAKFYKVVVQTAPEASRAVAAELDVEHHTPQIIVVRNGKAVYVSSHWGIRRAGIQRALESAA